MFNKNINLFLILVLFSFKPDIFSQTLKTYSNDFYKINYPSNWILDEKEMYGIIVPFFKLNDKDGNLLAQIHIERADTDVYLDLDDFTEGKITGMSTQTSIKVIKKQNIKFKNLPAKKIDYKNKNDEIQSMFISFFDETTKCWYALNYKSLSNNYLNYLGKGMKIINSFEIKIVENN